MPHTDSYRPARSVLPRLLAKSQAWLGDALTLRNQTTRVSICSHYVEASS
jgi:hypothetical protein